MPINLNGFMAQKVEIHGIHPVYICVHQLNALYCAAEGRGRGRDTSVRFNLAIAGSFRWRGGKKKEKRKEEEEAREAARLWFSSGQLTTG
jgi:hypothetical protein